MLNEKWLDIVCTSWNASSQREQCLLLKILKLQICFEVIQAELPREEQATELLVDTSTQKLISQYLRPSGVQVPVDKMFEIALLNIAEDPKESVDNRKNSSEEMESGKNWRFFRRQSETRKYKYLHTVEGGNK